MDSYLKQGGQSLIETTLAAAILLLLLTAILGITTTLKAELKHDFIETNDGTRESEGEQRSSAFTSEMTTPIFERLKGSVDDKISQLEARGWTVKEKLRGTNIILLVRDDKKWFSQKY